MNNLAEWGLKIGGSLDREVVLNHLLEAVEKIHGKTARMVIVPGGGGFADHVRARCGVRNVPGHVSHVQAALGMAQYGIEIAAKLECGALVHDEKETREVWRAGGIPVFIPYPFILTCAGIPKSWSATSDTVAVEICRALSISRLVLLKSVDGIMKTDGAAAAEVSAGSPPDTDVVDPLFMKHLTGGMEAYIINGRKPERLAAFFARGELEGTRIAVDKTAAPS
ncbi:MAG: hypothetical protein HZB29_06835 [Nitrospinae bacterium]|nr:hypothetical protein [Nitrospinota bacterium]